MKKTTMKEKAEIGRKINKVKAMKIETGKAINKVKSAKSKTKYYA